MKNKPRRHGIKINCVASHLLTNRWDKSNVAKGHVFIVREEKLISITYLAVTALLSTRPGLAPVCYNKKGPLSKNETGPARKR